MYPVHWEGRAPMMESRILYNVHPDPLWISEDYLMPRPGWLFLVMYRPRVTQGEFRFHYELGTPMYACTHERMPFMVRKTQEEVDHPDFYARYLTGTYFHPSDEWVREVARQFHTGERTLMRRGERFSDRDEHLTPCTVEIYRTGRDFRLNRYDYAEDSVLLDPACVGCGGVDHGTDI
jgi:hypothetical protein